MTHTLTMTFERFFNADYDEGECNLYIVWRNEQALYVGISESNIWNRWFGNLSPHILINAGGHWRGDYSSPIGAAVVCNRPASMQWIIELRYVPTVYTIPRWDVKREEGKLIRELRPLFNITHRERLTDDEYALYCKLSDPTGEIERAKRQALKTLHIPDLRIK